MGFRMWWRWSGAFLAGALLVSQTQLLLSPFDAALSLGLFALLFAWPSLFVRRAALCASAFVLGLSRASHLRQGAVPLERPEPSVFAVARIEGPCQRPCQDSVCHLWHRAQIVASAAHPDAPFVARDEQVWLRWSFDPELVHGDVILVDLQLRPLEAPRAFWLPTPKQQAAARGVSATATVRRPPVRLHAGSGLWATTERLRLRMARRLDVHLPPATAALTKALALGDPSSLSARQCDAFADAGIAHLLAVSGMHVAILARLVETVLRRAFALTSRNMAPGRMAAGLALAFVFFYAALTGMQTAVLRASTMAAFVLLARAFGASRTKSVRALCAAAVVIVWREPMATTHASALLSFACVLAFLTLMPQRTTQQTSILRALWLTMWQSVLASLASAPIVAAYFGRVALSAPVTNVVAIPLATLCLTPLALVTTALLAWDPASPFVAYYAWALTHLCTLLFAIAEGVATLPYAARPMPPWSHGTIALWASSWVVLAVALWQRRESTFLRRRHVTTLVGLCGLCVTAVVSCWPPPLSVSTLRMQGRLCIVQLDVGQGEATLVHLPTDQWMLVDGGGAVGPRAPDPGRLVVLPALRALGVHELALVVLTHPHPDHLLGLEAVLRAMPVKEFVFNEDSARHPLVRRWIRERTRVGFSSGLPRAHYRFGEAAVDITQAPLHGSRHKKGENDRSLVTSLRLHDHSFLLTGDIEKTAEHHLTALGPHDVLQVAHHGSKTSSDLGFLQAIQPQLALVSCGRDNRFGHPDASVCDRLQKLDIPVLSTARRGTIIVCSDGHHFTLTCGADPDCEDVARARRPSARALAANNVSIASPFASR